jgi:hypothetical protein
VRRRPGGCGRAQGVVSQRGLAAGVRTGAERTPAGRPVRQAAFARFAIQVWNQAPVGTPSFPYSESFFAWDRWSATPAHPAPVELSLAPQAERTFELPMLNPRGVQPLTIGSYDELNASDASARELKFKNSLSGKGHVEAILYLSDGTRKLEDWTGKSEVKLCRDRPEEDVTKLLIVTTNPSPTAGIPAYRHKMTLVNRCEPETISGPFSGSVDLSTQALPLPIKLSWQGTVTMREKDRLPFANADTFDLMSGTVNVEISGMIENCRIAGSTTLELLAANPGPLPGVLAVIDGTPRTQKATLAALLGEVPFTFHECEEEGKTGNGHC